MVVAQVNIRRFLQRAKGMAVRERWPRHHRPGRKSKGTAESRGVASFAKLRNAYGLCLRNIHILNGWINPLQSELLTSSACQSVDDLTRGGIYSYRSVNSTCRGVLSRPSALLITSSFRLPSFRLRLERSDKLVELLVANGREGQGDLRRLVESHRPAHMDAPSSSNCTAIGWPVDSRRTGIQ
jgi:hypothetical protein